MTQASPVIVDLIDGLRIERGCYWSPLTILMLGDYTNWNLFGQIRNRPDGDLFADFQFEPIILVDRVEAGVTKTYSSIIPFLHASQTLAIPATKLVSTGQVVAVGKNRWAFDIVIRNPTNSEIVLPVSEGIVEASDRITVIS